MSARKIYLTKLEWPQWEKEIWLLCMTLLLHTQHMEWRFYAIACIYICLSLIRERQTELQLILFLSDLSGDVSPNGSRGVAWWLWVLWGCACVLSWAVWNTFLTLWLYGNWLIDCVILFPLLWYAAQISLNTQFQSKWATDWWHVMSWLFPVHAKCHDIL